MAQPSAAANSALSTHSTSPLLSSNFELHRLAVLRDTTDNPAVYSIFQDGIGGI